MGGNEHNSERGFGCFRLIEILLLPNQLNEAIEDKGLFISAIHYAHSTSITVENRQKCSEKS